MKKSTSYILLLMLVGIVDLGIGLGIYNYSSQKALAEETEVVLSEGTATEMEVSLTDVVPGSSAAYTVSLKANPGDSFRIVLAFERIGEDSLAEFIDVAVMQNDSTLATGRLSEYLNGKSEEFSLSFDGESALELEIVYQMPLSVGDEAQNAAADFKVILTATR